MSIGDLKHRELRQFAAHYTNLVHSTAGTKHNRTYVVLDQWLRDRGLSWGDLFEIYARVRDFNSSSPLPANIAGLKDGDLKRFEALHSALLHSMVQSERTKAYAVLTKWLQSHGLTWGNLLDVLARVWVRNSSSAARDPHNANRSSPFPDSGFARGADFVRNLIRKYVVLNAHYLVAVTLWAIHSYVFDQFMITPRLHVRTPLHDGGKTTLLDVLDLLVRNPKKIGNASAAALCRILAKRPKHTVFLDEGDNLELGDLMRALFNENRKGWSVLRVIEGREVEFHTFAPLASNSIGSMHAPYMSRSITIDIQRASAEESATVQKFTTISSRPNELAEFKTAREFIVWFVQQVKLNADPEMPAFGRYADNWRVLVSIADAISVEWGRAARQAMLWFAAQVEQDDRVILLLHIRLIFDEEAIDYIASKKLIAELRSLDEADGMWSRLDEKGLAKKLKDFRRSDGTRIQPHQIWPGPRNLVKSFRGYERQDFEPAWARYCPPTPSGPHLRLVAGDSTSS
jgi:hypothetical protein